MHLSDTCLAMVAGLVSAERKQSAAVRIMNDHYWSSKRAYLALFLNLRTLLCIVATEPVRVFVPENYYLGYFYFHSF